MKKALALIMVGLFSASILFAQTQNQTKTVAKPAATSTKPAEKKEVKPAAKSVAKPAATTTTPAHKKKVTKKAEPNKTEPKR